jgi:predicted permease
LLVVAQVALSLLLVVGAGLFLRSFQNLTELPLGFQPEHVLSAAMNVKVGGYPPQELAALYQRLIERAESLPGVESASVAMCSLMSGCRSNADGLIFEGYQAAPDEQVMLQENRISPHYFSTVGMRIVAGRDIVAADSADPVRVAVLNEAAVRRYFKGREAVGQRFGYGEKPDIEIIGVVKDARVNTVREAVLPMAFYPLTPMPGYVGSLDVRVAGDPHALITSLRRAIAESDPKLPIDRIVTVADQAGSTLSQERLISRLTTLLSVLALALACLGLYGLMSYAVKQRTAELGLRLALGAPRGSVLWMVFRESLLLIAAGLAIGLPAVVAASRLVGTILFEVSPNDPATLGIAMTVLLFVGAWAGYLPAWRASNVDPLTALKEE